MPATSSSDTLILMLLVAGFAWFVGYWIGSMVAIAADSGWGLSAGAPIWLLGLASVVRTGLEHVRVDLPRAQAERAHLAGVRRVIDSVDPKRIITIDQVPLDARRRFKLLVTLANHASPDERDRALTELYTEATAMREGRWPLPAADLHVPPAAEDPPIDAAMARRLNVAGFQRDEWTRARASHDVVRQEWTEVLVDRLAVLDHPQLLDVSQPTTAAFVTAYSRVQDFCSVHGEEFDASLVDDYVRLTDEAVAAWERAKSQAEAAGASHLSPADQSRLSHAMELLERADDESLPVRRRVRATHRAARLLAKLESVQLPDDFPM